MKKLLPFLCFSLFALLGNSQCDELFFSEYVEGYANNKALEIYNPTGAAVNLSDYAIARFSNGSTVAGSNKVISLPDHMLEADDVFVVVVDLTDVEMWDSQFDKPAWNGYNVIDTLYDAVTGEAILDTFGNVIIGPQYLDGSALFGDEYNEEYDLQCKADAFLCPDYDTNNTMYFNGNDAVALISGSEVALDGSNIIDVIGVIGEDPTVTLMQDAWVDEFGGWLTKDKTLVRNYDVAGGRNDFSEVIASVGGSFTGEGWTKERKNDFSFLGIHSSVCNSEDTPEKYSCSLGPLNTTDLNKVSFALFPNPNSLGTLQIEAEEKVLNIEVFDIIGKRVLFDQRKDQSNNVTLELRDLNAGTYMVKVHFPNNNFSVRTLIVK